MADHFAAFSFVDRITAMEPGVRARGEFAVPRDVPSFPSCLVAEAVGQLAAWVAMAHVEFRGRPVAALANETRFHRDVAPGDTLLLGVEIEQLRRRHRRLRRMGEARRRARSSSSPIAWARCCRSKNSIRRRARRAVSRCCAGRAPTPGAFTASRCPGWSPATTCPGESLTATLHVPGAAPFFADHFPRRAVFPATLLLDSQIGSASSSPARRTVMARTSRRRRSG